MCESFMGKRYECDWVRQSVVGAAAAAPHLAGGVPAGLLAGA